MLLATLVTRDSPVLTAAPLSAGADWEGVAEGLGAGEPVLTAG